MNFKSKILNVLLDFYCRFTYFIGYFPSSCVEFPFLLLTNFPQNPALALKWSQLGLNCHLPDMLLAQISCARASALPDGRDASVRSWNICCLIFAPFLSFGFLCIKFISITEHWLWMELSMHWCGSVSGQKLIFFMVFMKYFSAHTISYRVNLVV